MEEVKEGIMKGAREIRTEKEDEGIGKKGNEAVCCNLTQGVTEGRE